MLSRLRQKNLHQWLPDYVGHLARQRLRQRRFDGPVHVLVAVCDHYEPLWGKAEVGLGKARVKAWLDGYPAMVEGLRDSHGRTPRHSWFFPGEEYHPYYLDALAGLVAKGHGEVEVHLHHDGDTEASLRSLLQGHLQLFMKHGHLARDAAGRPRWAFIHGNWSLANARPDGRWCGVDAELPLLFDLGCYADFTFPSAPDACQPNHVNKLYWPVGDLRQRKCFEHGTMARVGQAYDDRLLMVTGPLALTRKGRGLRLENGAITGDDPATPARVRAWVAQHIHVQGRADWVFVKVHTHGALERTAASYLGAGGRAMHETLTTEFNDGHRYRLHYVTAREMYNVAMAAMRGREGDPAAYYDYVVAPPPVAAMQR